MAGEVLLYFAIICIIVACLCGLEHIIYKKNWWLPRFLNAICHVPEEGFTDDKD